MSWIDPGPIDETIAERAAAMMGLSLEDECYCDLLNYADPFDPVTEDDGQIEIAPPLDLPSSEPGPYQQQVDIIAPDPQEPEFVELPPQPDFEADK